MIDAAIRWMSVRWVPIWSRSMNEQSLQDRNFFDNWIVVNRSMINETIIGYMEDEEHNDQDTCVMIIWWFRNYHNYLFGGVKLLSSCLLVCRAVSLSLSSPALWLSPSVPFSVHLSLSVTPHPTNMFVCSVPPITEYVSITTYFYKISLNKCSIVLTFLSHTHTHAHTHARTHASRSYVVFSSCCSQIPKII